jgi:ribonuclease HI
MYLKFRGPESISKPSEQAPITSYATLFNLMPQDNPHMEIWEPATVFFTDGSFQSGSPNIGCAAVFEDRRISAILTKSPTTFCSSTTAELGGILLALQTSYPNVLLKIFTDAQACIGKIANYHEKSNIREKLRKPDNDILDCLLTLQNSRISTCKIRWIKGHAGNTLSENRNKSELYLPN